MPITIKCTCGKALRVKDELAGKAVKCPGCGQPVRVPGGPAAGSAATKPARPAAKPASPAAKPARPVTQPVAKPTASPNSGANSSAMSDLFAEEGMDQHVSSICPNCTAVMQPGTVLCMKCGFNQQSGEVMTRHLVAGVDIDAGQMALNKAESDMQKAAQAQADMIGRSGMPPSMLALILFILGSATGIAVLAVNASRRAEAIEFSPMRMFLNLGGSAFLMVGIGGVLSLISMAFRIEKKQGLLSLTILYLFVFVMKYRGPAVKILITAIICFTIAGLMFAGASRY